ncbi:unnamed protein product [Microthlaspi erraticum]|uniref:Uncharacterized protein n=1 Tax=Microthlaspi erraticum TaxID=1685480 RepID=A0A6D2J5Z5_9BRAS|nr:unnamed protein product [Microthlaspi erraticum]
MGGEIWRLSEELRRDAILGVCGESNGCLAEFKGGVGGCINVNKSPSYTDLSRFRDATIISSPLFHRSNQFLIVLLNPVHFVRQKSKDFYAVLWNLLDSIQFDSWFCQQDWHELERKTSVAVALSDYWSIL